MPFQLSEWESSIAELPYYFGFPEDAVPVSELGPGIYVIRPAPEVAHGRLAELGYQYLDTMVELTLCRPERPLELAHQVRATGPQDQAGIQTIAHGADVIFGNGVANRIYRTVSPEKAAGLMRNWTYNSLNERAERAGHINHHSFVTVRRIDDFREQIDLMGVHPDHRGHGYGTALATWAAWTSNRPILTVRTELRNSGAIGVYLKAGFRPTSQQSMYWARVAG